MLVLRLRSIETHEQSAAHLSANFTSPSSSAKIARTAVDASADAQILLRLEYIPNTVRNDNLRITADGITTLVTIKPNLRQDRRITDKL